MVNALSHPSQEVETFPRQLQLFASKMLSSGKIITISQYLLMSLWDLSEVQVLVTRSISPRCTLNAYHTYARNTSNY
jgi:hypothetical protein